MRKAGDILEALFRERFDPQLLEHIQATASLFSSWPAVAGDADIAAAAAHSRIREFERGVILVEAEHPGWVQLLQTKQTRLLKAVRGRFPELEVRGVSFCLSREPISLKKPGASDDAASGTPGAPVVSAPVPEEEAPEESPGEGGEFQAVMKRLEKSIKKRNKISRR
ncbi:MAG: DUF721 domain-containing protein [Treponema sp.]|jgi:hypothetical protein|nr:DUF721 domain-containing protein [Treponema sp.]